MKKKILLGVGMGFAVVILAAVIIVGFFLGDVVKVGMNTVGPKVTQTTFSVDSVHISALTGSASLDNFVIGSPEGYKADHTIRVGKTAVSISPLSVMSDKIVVKSIEVRDPDIVFEGNPLGANNLKKIMENVNAFSGAAEAKPDTNAPAKPTAKPAKKLEVDHFLITGAKVHFNGAVLPLPNIELNDLGKGPEGITPAALIKEVLGQITTDSIKAIGSSVGNAGKAIGNEASKIGKGIGDLFKK